MSRSNFRFLTCIFLFFLVSGCKPATESPDSSEFIRAMNRGKAHLENKDAPGAIRAFSEAVDQAPDSAPARRNLARAYLQAREIEPVAEVLARAIVLEVDSPANHYLSGLAHARQSEFDQAVRQYEEAVRLDPTTATLRFQLASAYQAVGDHEKASHQLKETLRLDPFHTAAHYRLAGYARKSGDRKELKYRLREVKRLRSLFSDKSRSAELLERCQYSLAEPPLRAAGSERHAATRVQGVRFLEVTSEWLPGESERTAPVIAASLLQLGKDGRYTLFAADRDGQIRLLTSEKNGALRDTTLKSTLSAGVLSSQRLISLPGNFHDSVPEGTPYDPEIHARNDLVLVGDGGVQLLEQTAAGTLDDVTSRAGLSEARGTAVEWMDYDHDGDIDLILGDERGLQLWQNGGDGQFANVSAEAGIDESKPVRDLQAADLDNDVAIDLVVARGTALQPEATQIFENQRTGTFSARPAVPGPWPASGRLLIDDLDNDGMLDTLLIGESEVLILPGSGATRVHLDLGGLQPRAAVLLDVDNNGWLDLLLAGTDAGAAKGSRLMLWSFDASDGWREVSDATGLAALSLPTVSDLLAADLDADGDTDLTLVTSDGLRLLRNDGGEANGQLKIRLVGTKTNPGGIGTRVEVRAGKYWVARSVSALPVEIGLAGRTQLDSVYTVWTNGVVDNQIQIPAPPDTLTLIEKHVAAGSCPYLYAWSGKTFRFVTDLLGNSPLGLSLRRGQVLSADPEELVWIGDSKSFVPRDGHYVLQVTEELREVLYLDEARLIAVDHAPDVEVHPTDRLMPPPYPASEIWPLAQPRIPKLAKGSDGVDRTRAVSAIDGNFAPPGPLRPPPLRGQTHPHTLTLDFGSLEGLREPVLTLTGWLQWGDASTNIAMSQNRSLAVIPLTLEMETPDGNWHPVPVTVGRPAGKTKTIAIDLTGKLHPGTKRLRLQTSFELRWDRIALLERVPRSAAQIHSIKPDHAELGWRGYSEIRSRAPHHPTTPDWNTVNQQPPWRTTPEGWATRYGDVRELVDGRDGKLVLLGGGDALDLRFAASALPPVPPGKVRSFFFRSVGWDKDADHNVVDGDTIEPLPVLAEADDEWRVRFNTRWIPGDTGAQSARPATR